MTMQTQQKVEDMRCSKDDAANRTSAQGGNQATNWWRSRQSLGGLVLFGLIAIAVPIKGYAEDAKPSAPGVQRKLLHQSSLPDLPGHIVTALTIEIAPGAVVGPHRHGGFVYVYLLEGRMRSQMEGTDPVEYSAGQSWIEPAGVLHRHTENPSGTEPAKFLAVIYSAENAVITQPERSSRD
jgi:quercetin dioxygenase-like cupin family protein